MEYINIFTLIALTIGSILFFYGQKYRAPLDVLNDLEEKTLVEKSNKNINQKKLIQAEQILQNYNSNKDKAYKSNKFYLKNSWILPLIVAAFVNIICSFILNLNSSQIFPFTIASYSLGYIFVNFQVRKEEESYFKSLQYNLPLVMERLVMTVEAGLDLLAGIKIIVEQEKETNRNKINPVVELLEVVLKLTEAGLSFSESLNQVGRSCPIPAVKHAFIHLALAYKEGGELVMPLRELSDATQLNFEETVEEEIAKLPVKATLPLVVIFAGMITFFITAPMIQVLEVTSKAKLNVSATR